MAAGDNLGGVEHFRARSLRAWQDFKAFAKKHFFVRLNLVVITAVVTFLVGTFLIVAPSWPQLAWAVLIGLLSLIALLVGSFVWNFLRAPARLWGEQKALIQQLQNQLSAKKQSTTVEEWKKMAGEFEMLKDPALFLISDRFDEGPPRWQVGHANDRDAQRRFQAASRLAGRLVTRSPYCQKYLMDSAMKERDDANRWYETLKHLGQAIQHSLTMRIPTPGENTQVKKETIVDIVQLSITLCFELASKEEN